MVNFFKKNNSNKKSGMTFIEVVIAGLLMVVVFIIGWTISQSFVGVRKVRNYETAVFLANQAIEAIRAARSRELGKDGEHRNDTLLADFSSSKDVYDKYGCGFLSAVNIGGVEYKREVSIKDCASKTKINPKLKLIKVKVSWKTNPRSKPIEFEVVTTHCEQD